MKQFVLLASFLFAFTANATTLRDVVLGVDFQAYDDESPYMFPCNAYMGVMFCDNHVVIRDKTCSKSIRINDQSGIKVVSCTTAKGEDVALAWTEKNARLMEDDTQAAGYYRLTFSPIVELKKINDAQSILIINK